MTFDLVERPKMLPFSSRFSHRFVETILFCISRVAFKIVDPCNHGPSCNAVTTRDKGASEGTPSNSIEKRCGKIRRVCFHPLGVVARSTITTSLLLACQLRAVNCPRPLRAPFVIEWHTDNSISWHLYGMLSKTFKTSNLSFQSPPPHL